MRPLRLKSVNETLGLIHASFSQLTVEAVQLCEACGRYLAEAVVSREDVPAFNRSTVDGFAVTAQQTFGAQSAIPALLELSNEVEIGTVASEIAPNECCYVPTGGMLPTGANAVVMVEYAEVMDTILNIYRPVTPGENVIFKGEDVNKGYRVFGAGRKLRVPEIGVLASLGIPQVNVVRSPVVGIFSTGDELVDMETPNLEPGRVRDSTGTALSCLVRQAGGIPIMGGILPDAYDNLITSIKEMLERTDMIVLSGGSSMGYKDYVPEVLRELSNGDLLVEGVAVKPGKPTLLGKCKGKPILGLPGHPVSALSIFTLFGIPLLKRLAGAKSEDMVPTVTAKLSRNIRSHPGRTDLVRVRLYRENGIVTATPILGSSGLMSTLAEADGLVIVDEQVDGIAASTFVDVQIWS